MNVFPPPSPPDAEPAHLVPVSNAHEVAWPKKKWLKLPLWCWITVGVLAAGAIGSATTKDSNQAVSVVPLDSATTLEATTDPTATLPEVTLAPTTLPATTLAPITLPATTVPSMHEQFVSWVMTEDLSGLTTEFVAALDPISVAAADLDWFALGSACVGLHDVNARLAATLPSPSSEMNTALQSMTDDYDMAMHLCEDSALTLDVTALDQSSVYMGRGTDHAAEVNAILGGI